jgi:hypothetical protein
VARYREPVLGAFELRLQGEEILVRFELGISLRHREQPAERARQLGLGILEFLESFGIVDELRRHLDRGRARARLEHLALLLGKT